MSDILAAVGIIQLRKIEKIIARKRELAQYWNEKLIDLNYFEPPLESPGNYHIYQSYVATVEKKISRNRLIENLLKQGIQTQIGTYASHIQPVYQYTKKCPISFDIFSRSIALPLYYDLKIDEIDLIIDRIQKEIRLLK
jgi:dTDP-4-amino-4,6-dideoxygalactose transaminase